MIVNISCPLSWTLAPLPLSMCACVWCWGIILYSHHGAFHQHQQRPTPPQAIPYSRPTETRDLSRGEENRPSSSSIHPHYLKPFSFHTPLIFLLFLDAGWPSLHSVSRMGSQRWNSFFPSLSRLRSVYNTVCVQLRELNTITVILQHCRIFVTVSPICALTHTHALLPAG